MRPAILLSLSCLLMAGSAAAAVTEDNFRLQTTEDLVTLCTAAPEDPMHTQAIHICHGYLVGAHHYHDVMRLGPEPLPALFCPPDPLPSRDEVVAGWAAWSTSSTADDGDQPLESVLRYLITTYPCAS